MYIYTQSADRAVSSFVDSSAQHKEMRLDLIAMKDEILKTGLNQARANFARVLKLQAMSEAQCSGKARPQESALPNTKERSEILNKTKT